MATVMVTCPATTPFGTKHYTLVFSKLPGRKFGPYEFAEAVTDLRISALLSPVDARNLVMEAATSGSAVRETS